MVQYNYLQRSIRLSSGCVVSKKIKGIVIKATGNLKLYKIINKVEAVNSYLVNPFRLLGLRLERGSSKFVNNIER